jgi:hypothetical protein
MTIRGKLLEGSLKPLMVILSQTLTYMRILVNVIVGFMLGCLFWSSGNEGSRVMENYKLLFSILIHLMMTTMMLTILTCMITNQFFKLDC